MRILFFRAALQRCHRQHATTSGTILVFVYGFGHMSVSRLLAAVLASADSGGCFPGDFEIDDVETCKGCSTGLYVNALSMVGPRRKA
jgi:hypothetical protein